MTLFLPEAAEATNGRAEWFVPALPLQFRSEKPIRYDGCRECVPSFVLADYSNIGFFMRRLLDLQYGGHPRIAANDRSEFIWLLLKGVDI